MTVRCFRCGTPTNVPFAERGPCACGSRAWFQGNARPLWPPMEAPAFLAGQFPGGDVLSLTSLPIRNRNGRTYRVTASDLPLLVGPGSVQGKN